MGDRRPVVHDALAQQQERILATLARGLALAAVVVGPIIWFQVDDHTDPRLWILLALTSSFVALYCVRHWLSFRANATWLLCMMTALSAYSACLRGPTVGTMALQSMSLLLAALFFGAPGTALAFAACIASLVAAGVLLTNGYLEPWAAAFWDPLAVLVWVRYAALLTILAGTIALAYTQVVRGITRTAHMLNETLARERTEREQRELAQAALERARRDEALAQLAAGIAHDLANHLMVVAAHAEFIGSAPEASPQIAQDASLISETLAGTKALLDRLSALGSSDLRRSQPLQLEAPIAWLDKALRRLLPAEIVLRTHVTTHDAVALDASQLEQALLNLGLNARDAMPRGGTLEFQVTGCTVESAPPGWNAEPGRFVRISCRDSGVGMDVATQQRIFEPFFTTKETGRGTGLGLAMVRRLVYDAGGFIRVESTVGQGTVFHLHFPVHVATAAAAPTSQPPSDAAPTSDPVQIEANADDAPSRI